MLPAHVVHGECLPFLHGIPESIVNLVVTSPPYNLGNSPSARKHPQARRGSGLDWRGYGPDTDALPEPDYQAQQVEVLQALYRVCKPGASVCYVHMDRLGGGRLISPLEWLQRGPFAVRQQIVWAKGKTHRWDGHHFPPLHEYVYWLTKEPWQANERQRAAIRRWPDVWQIPPERVTGHPAPFPYELARRCIVTLSEPGDLVLDPYMGSGTTGAAARALERHFGGCDRHQPYVELARARVPA
jgi:site-specific DNA-methyltransferase (adenine-specific)